MITYHNNYFTGSIPVCWDEEYKLLPYTPGRITNTATEDEWLNQGHIENCLIIAGYHHPNPMPAWLNQVYSNWDWCDFSTSLHRIDPGKYYPMHKDFYPKYSMAFNVATHEIIRMVLFLEDWKAGQVIQVDNDIIHKWKAGDFVGWFGDVPHLTANLGEEPRYAAVITCHK